MHILGIDHGLLDFEVPVAWLCAANCIVKGKGNGEFSLLLAKTIPLIFFYLQK